MSESQRSEQIVRTDTPHFKKEFSFLPHAKDIETLNAKKGNSWLSRSVIMATLISITMIILSYSNSWQRNEIERLYGNF